MINYTQARSSQYGFTLTELLMTVIIGIILATTAIPAFSTMLEESRMMTQMYEFVAHLNYAREVAITKNRQITLCKSSDGLVCDNSLAWRDGWIAFIDSSGDRVRTADEPLLRVQEGVKENVSINYSASLGHNNYVVFRPMGNSPDNGTFTFCSALSEIEPRAVILARTGKIRLDRVKPNGDPLTCP